ncbi:MAG: metal-dependent protein of the double-stranded beta helix superfamily-like protein [Myxococcaceae bacterium]|nr:metal-dependent protein of the double-stranded beta helix superfamily-like protein [Myxococcaceae bacterium]
MTRSTSSFDIAQLIDACRAAVAAPDAERAVRELLAEAMSEPGRVAAALGEPRHAGIATLYRAADLTVIDFTWAPWMCLKPHNHNMWSVVGIVAGREDNVFWRRTEQSIEAAGARSLGAGEVAPLGVDIIHSVTNPIGKMTRAIHVYGGDFFAPVRPRSEWDHETLSERPWDLEGTRRLFADAEARSGSVPIP